MSKQPSRTEVNTTGQDFVLARTFDAPRGLVFKAWTDPTKLACWFGPKIFENRCEIDLRPNGAYRIVMRSPEGIDYPIKGIYREIMEPERLVMTVNCDEHPIEWHKLVNENRSQAPTKLEEMLWIVTLKEHDGTTELSIQTKFGSPGDRDALLKMGMRDGWSESLDKLDDLLSNMKTEAKVKA
jgi:uncharacterized protein YndB with AHSA1/START domain